MIKKEQVVVVVVVVVVVYEGGWRGTGKSSEYL